MKPILISMLALLLSIGCKKETTVSESSSDFTITLLREFSNGERLIETEKPVQSDKPEGPNVYFDASGTKLVLRIGRNAKPETKLGANIVFLKETDPIKVVGTYQFPTDLDKVDIELFEYSATGFTRTSIPSQGTLTMSYDPQFKTFRGTVEQLSYYIPFRADYVFQMITMRFDGVKYR